jgi:hypothetical protein
MLDTEMRMVGMTKMLDMTKMLKMTKTVNITNMLDMKRRPFETGMFAVAKAVNTTIVLDMEILVAAKMLDMRMPNPRKFQVGLSFKSDMLLSDVDFNV